jgi:ABC-type glutathione transport system ATPase component
MRSVSDVDDSDLDTDLCSANESDVKMPDISLSSSLHLDAYALVDETCLQFAELTKHEPVTGELQQFFKHVMDSLKNAVNPQPHTVAVVGKTGSGKSTLLCALVQSMVLPSSSLVCAAFI